MIELRPYQREAIQAVADGYRRGLRRMVIAHATGLGKTICFSTITQGGVQKERRVLILAHRDELLGQAQEKLLLAAPELSGEIGVVKAERREWKQPVTVASVQSLHAKRLERMIEEGAAWDIVIVDECFPAGTMVGGVPIEQIRVGDTVPSFDKHACEGKVVRIMRSVPTAGLVRIHLSNGEQIVCTPHHPFLTKEGWLPAGELRGRMVRYEQSIRERTMQNLRQDCGGDDEVSSRPPSKSGLDLLLQGVYERVPASRELGDDGANESQVRSGADAQEQSDASRRREGAYAREVEVTRMGHRAKGRERQAYAGTATETRGASRMGDRVRRRDEAPARVGIPVPLQDRHRPPETQDRRRGGRSVTCESPGSGRAQGRSPRWIRVDRVEVLQPGSDGRYGGLCPDGLVYNLEVAGTHTYRVGSGYVAHNCHHAGADSYQRILQALGCMAEGTQQLTLGVTATPQRNDSKDLGDTFQEVVHHVGMLAGMRAGYLSDLRGIQVRLAALDLGTVKTSRGDYQDSASAASMMEAEAPRHVVGAWRVHAPERRTIVFTPTIQMAHAMADEFRHHGVRATGLSGETPPEERRGILKAFSAGEVQVVCNAQVLTEGFDAPQVDCIVIARPTKSQLLYQQMIGRGTRTYPGKQDCLIIDTVGATERLDLVTVPALFGLAKESAEAGPEQTVLSLDVARAERQTREGRIVARQVDLFDRQNLAWTLARKGLWVLGLQGEQLLLQLDGGTNTWSFFTQDSRRGSHRILRSSGLDLGYAMGTAEDYARRSPNYVNKLVSKTAGWRSRPVSDGQKEALARFGIPTDGLNKGEASDRLTAAIANARASRR